MSTKPAALTTLANLKSALKISTTTDDSNLEKLIDRASDWIENQTNRKLKARKYNAAGSTHGTTGVADEDYLFFSGNTLDRGGDTLIEQGRGVFHLPQYPV